MGQLELTVACAPTDRVAPIMDGRIPIEGCRIQCFPIDPEEAFARAYASQDFDITEISASSHILATSRGKTHYVGLPIFTMRCFRHSAFYIRTDRGIASPGDLRGKLVGVPEYQMTANLWARGLLADEYGVKAQEIRWRNGGLNQAGRTERMPLSLPPGFDLQPVPTDKTLSELLQSGALDAVIAPRAPASYLNRAPHIGRLFPDLRASTEAYYRKTSLFPIMHHLAIRRELVEAHRWLAASVMKAFLKARRLVLDEMEDPSGLSVMLPWLADDLERAQALMGRDLWPYGVTANRKELDAMLRWSVEQGLAERVVDVDELFAPGTTGHFQLKDV